MTVRNETIQEIRGSSQIKKCFCSLTSHSEATRQLLTTDCKWLRLMYHWSTRLFWFVCLRECIKISNVIFFHLSKLQVLMNNIEKNNLDEKHALRDTFYKKLVSNLKKVCLNEQLFVDVTFELDDGKCYAHRSLLMARCAVMKAMFGGEFRESTAQIVSWNLNYIEEKQLEVINILRKGFGKILSNCLGLDLYMI
ncbi:UNVERIFIED_CONTAM: Rho-related BTB domain-containing protein 1 [Trichonephila clavipes]